MNTLKWAENELRLAGYNKDDQNDGPNKWLAENVLELLETMNNQGHSGSSAPFLIRLFERLASHKPLTPLLGNDEEWSKIDNNTWQNIRDSSVFKNEDGKAYIIDGIVFWEWYSAPTIDDGKPYKVYFTSSDSRQFITFPWLKPDTPEYKFSPSEQFPHEDLT